MEHQLFCRDCKTMTTHSTEDLKICTCTVCRRERGGNSDYSLKWCEMCGQTSKHTSEEGLERWSCLTCGRPDLEPERKPYTSPKLRTFKLDVIHPTQLCFCAYDKYRKYDEDETVTPVMNLADAFATLLTADQDEYQARAKAATTMMAATLWLYTNGGSDFLGKFGDQLIAMLRSNAKYLRGEE